jgi:hypothetical protein
MAASEQTTQQWKYSVTWPRHHEDADDERFAKHTDE